MTKEKIKNKLKKLLVVSIMIKIRNKLFHRSPAPPYKPLPPYSQIFTHNTYGKFYLPFYNTDVPLINKYPDIYNSDGEKMELFFIRDVHGAHLVYSNSKYFQFDRYNFGLDTHFYTHNSMLETMGNPKKKYGMLIEAEIIVPGDYNIFERNKGLENDFDLVFTYSDKILQSIPNSRYVPYYIRPWYGYRYMTESADGVIEKEKLLSSSNYENKTKNISIIASGKEFVPLHKHRNAIARQCKTKNLADTYGTFDGGKFCDISEPFKDYRFSIVIENEITPYGFTEKITNCFAAMTIPVYLGASKIDTLFNPYGIIKFEMTDDIETVLKKCTKEFYNERIPAIIENFKKIINGKSSDDIIYENYLSKDVGKISPEELIKLL
jgi:hypothetical protein